ncbi:MAG: DUF5053 domain-containing protein [Tannerella sp.]|jgi:flagellar biosynthesis chaperone FliJ|nr:DUF5053 domain-containing protein [Tannerella sp.]
MDIKRLMTEYHQASELERKEVEERIQHQFKDLTEAEQKQVQQEFLENLDSKIDEADNLIKEVTVKLELEKISGYLSMAYISKAFFGKSRQWLNNRIKGNRVNGKPVEFTKEELNRFSSALLQLSEEVRDTALRINC